MDLTLNSAAIPNEPFAIAFSGGGDSTALLHALRHRAPLVLIVDHGLRAGSAREAQLAQGFAQDLGLKADILSWSPELIKSGLQAKARHARYRLLGEACREAGISYLLTGHTEDDQAETVLMRLKAGGSWRGAAGMKAVTVSPLWPELASVKLCRPMLEISRATIRVYLEIHDLNYVDDPSNENRDFARIRARDELSTRPLLRSEMLSLSHDMQAARMHEAQRLSADFKRSVKSDEFGSLYLSEVPNAHLLGSLIRAASGTAKTPKEEALRRLKSAMRSAAFRGGSLGGALVVARKSGWLISRDPVASKGRSDVVALGVQRFAGRSIWDGRFSIEGEGSLAPSGEAWIEAPKPLKDAIMGCPAKARASLPMWTQGGQIVAIGPYDINGALHGGVKSVVLPRLKREFSLKSP